MNCEWTGIPRVIRVTAAAVGLVVALVAAAGAFIPDEPPGAGAEDGHLLLESGSFDPATALPKPVKDFMERKDGWIRDDAPNRFVVQFRGRNTDPIRAAIGVGGGRVLGYLPRHAFLVEGDRAAIEEIGKMESTRWTGPWAPWFKVSEELREELAGARGSETARYMALLFPGTSAGAVADGLRGLGIEVVDVVEISPRSGDPRGVADRIVFSGDAAAVATAAGLNDVSWIEPLLLPEKRNDTVQWVVQSNVTNSRSIWQHRLFGVGQIIGHIDGRIDKNNCYFRDDVNPVGPDHRKLVAYRSSSGYGQDSHGTHTAGTAAGDATYTGGSWTYDGMAPGARLSHSNLDDVNSSNLYQYLLWAHEDGAHVHTNSWGNDWTTSYTQWCRDIDRFSHDYEDDLVVFATTNLNSLKTPENAKNVLAVGATSAAPGQENHCTGGRGPTADGRRKPEILAPGCETRSARSGTSCSSITMSGTSMAAPAITGAAALVREYYETGWYPSGAQVPGDGFAPTGALVKATLLNGAVDMTGVGGYPSDREGWGRLLLENALYFDGDPGGLIVREVRMSGGFSTGDADTIFFRVNSADVPLRVTLVWHDEPATVGASLTPINNLDLYAKAPAGPVFRGNVFSGGQSVPGGSPDELNNVEQIQREGPETGDWALLVRGTEVNMGPQGYALVISGDVSEMP